MAIFKPGAIVQAISGNLSGVNFVNAARSVYIRKARRPNNSTSTAQLAIQANFGIVTNLWAKLSTSLRTTWTTAAKSLAHVNRIGIPTTLSGREFFFLRNLENLNTFALPTQTAPPTMASTKAVALFQVTNASAANIYLYIITVPTLVDMPIMLAVANPYTNTNPNYFHRWQIFYQGLLLDLPLNSYTIITAKTGLLRTGQNLKFLIRPRYLNLLAGPPTQAPLTITNP